MFQPKLICFDLNKTLIRENSWRDLNLAMGVTAAEDDMLGAWGEQGIITDQQGQDILCAIYKARGADSSRSNIDRIVQNYSWMAGAQETVQKLQADGHEVILISGAMDILVKDAAEKLSIKEWRASNQFIFDDNDQLEWMAAPEKDEHDKLRQLATICHDRGIQLSDCVVIGDGANDRKLFEATGRGVTFIDSPIVPLAWTTITSLSEIPDLFRI